MNSTVRHVAPLVVSTLLFAVGVAAQKNTPHWPQWRGPDRDGIAKERDWAPNPNAKKLWTRDVGMGYSTVSIADGRLFTIGHDKEKQEDTVFALDSQTGKELWKHTFPAKTMAMAHKGGSLTTPSIDGQLVFASNREGNFFCFDAGKGKIKWKKNLIKSYSATMPKWGLAASPLVLEEMIVMNVGPVIAFKRNGKVAWKSKDYGHAYATPVDFELKGKKYLAVFSGAGLVVLSRKRGKEVAKSAWKTKYDVNAATPVVIGDRIFISSGYNHGCSMLQFSGKKLKTLWENREMRNHMSGCVLYEDHLYGFDETRLKCLDLDGEVQWGQRGLGKGALLLADGKILALTRRGDLVTAEASPTGYSELSRQRILDDGGVQWTTPVLAGGLCYCRSSMGQLVCVDLRKKPGEKQAGEKQAPAKKGQ